jgi:hypothetical protein
VFTLVRRARQRLLYNELLSQGANASSAALIALILLLLFGTEVLDWRWALAIPLVAAAAGVYLARRRLPPPYTVAQMLDRRCALADTLSTALFFTRGEPASHVSRDIRQAQFEQAGRLSETVDVRRAVPYTLPRAAYLLVALLVVAASLFALRYGLSRRLDLKPPLARILQLKFGANQPAEQARAQRPKAPEEPGSRDDGTAPSSDPDQPPDASSDPIQDTVAGQPGGKSDPDQTRQSPARQAASDSGESSSLLTRAEDAIENLLSSLQPPRNLPGAQPKSVTDKAGGQQPAKGQPGGGQPGNSPDGQPGKEASDSQDSQGQSAGTGDTEQAGKQPGSGAGNQDGEKNARQAEQLAAMGKISEIIGKRSANVTGEATVEVRSTSQQLRTPYAARGAQHSQGGSEIGRDEIPVALQTYVERYFEQVRQPPLPGK